MSQQVVPTPTSLMVPLLEVEDIPGTTSWRVTLRGDGYGVGTTRYFDGPDYDQNKKDADRFVDGCLRAVLEANKQPIKGL